MDTRPPLPAHKQNEWNLIQHIAKGNVYPHNFNQKLEVLMEQPPQNNTQAHTTTPNKKWATFTYYGP
jgi:hypothetical protein